MKFILPLILLFSNLAGAQSGVSASYLKLTAASLPAVCSAGTTRFSSGQLNLCYPANTWSAVGTAAVWGGIGGTLSSQTDLQTALNLKAPLASPTFTGSVTLPIISGILKVTSGGVVALATPSDFPTLNQNTSGTAAGLSSTLVVGSGGTGLGSLTANNLLVGAGSSNVTFIAPGTSGNVLASNGSVWASATPTAGSPLTTKGDIFTFASANARQAVPGDYGQLIADSSQTNGWRSASYLQLQNGRPGKNYIQYSDFNNGATTGWSLGHIPTITNGLPASNSPTFGTGANANLSISAITSSPMAGLGNLGYVSAAASTVGDMVASSAYTIDAEDQAKVMTVKFYYIKHSGTIAAPGTSSNSFAWAVWDATNSVWLSTAGQFCITQTTGIGYCTGTFQTGSSTASIRFAVYNATATAGAATMYFDDFYVGPQTAPMGPSVTDIQSNLAFTPTNFGTVTSATYNYKRVGDVLYVSGNFTMGTTVASIASINLPSGYSIDTTKLSSSSSGTTRGIAYVATSSSNTISYGINVWDIFYDGSTTTGLFFAEKAGSSALTKDNGNAICSSACPMSFEFSVPIVGWSSNTSMSSDTDTRVVAMSANNTSAQVVSNSTATTITSWTTEGDSHGAFVSSTGIYTIPVSGYYDISAELTGLSSTGTVFQTYILRNGSVIRKGGWNDSGGSGNALIPALVSINGYPFNDGDTVSIQYFQTSGGNVTLFSGDTTKNFFSISRRSGPAVIAATESVNARYFSSASVITSALANITYATKDFDSHNAMSGATYTIPVSGKYLVNASLSVTDATIAAGNTGILQLNKNGSAYANDELLAGAATTKPLILKISTLVTCLAQDTITIQASLVGTTPTITSSNTYNFFSISRVGN